MLAVVASNNPWRLPGPHPPQAPRSTSTSWTATTDQNGREHSDPDSGPLFPFRASPSPDRTPAWWSPRPSWSRPRPSRCGDPRRLEVETTGRHKTDDRRRPSTPSHPTGPSPAPRVGVNLGSGAQTSNPHSPSFRSVDLLLGSVSDSQVCLRRTDGSRRSATVCGYERLCIVPHLHWPTGPSWGLSVSVGPRPSPVEQSRPEHTFLSTAPGSDGSDGSDPGPEVF